MCLVLVPVGEYLLDEVVKVGVGAEGALRGQLLPAGGALLIAGSQRRDDALGAKPEWEMKPSYLYLTLFDSRPFEYCI